MKPVARVLVALSLAAGLQAVHAAPAATALTRAEVQADLHLYREAGLYLLDASEVSPLSAEYRAAQVQYGALRASPRYAQLVEHYGATGADRVAVAAR